MARPCGFTPTSMLPTIRSDAVSMTLTTEAPSLDTYTLRPSGVITSPWGPLGTGMVATIRAWAGSITPTASSLNSPTYTFGPGAAAGIPAPPSQATATATVTATTTAGPLFAMGARPPRQGVHFRQRPSASAVPRRNKIRGVERSGRSRVAVVAGHPHESAGAAEPYRLPDRLRRARLSSVSSHRLTRPPLRGGSMRGTGITRALGIVVVAGLVLVAAGVGAGWGLALAQHRHSHGAREVPGWLVALKFETHNP